MAEKPRMEISATQVIGGALAAASAAVAASLLGVYGTVVGAAVVSVVASVGGALYTHSFRKGKQAIDKARETRTVRFWRVPPQQPAEAETDTTPTEQLASADQGTTYDVQDDDRPTVVDAAGTPEDDEPTVVTDAAGEDDRPTVVGDPVADDTDTRKPTLRERLRSLNPKAVALTAACILVISMSGIVFAESFMGKTVSDAVRGKQGHGNTVGNALNGGGEPSESPTPTDTSSITSTPTPTASSSSSPKSGPTESSTPPSTTSKKPTTSKPTTSKPTTSKPATTKLPTTAPTGESGDDKLQQGDGQ